MIRTITFALLAIFTSTWLLAIPVQVPTEAPKETPQDVPGFDHTHAAWTAILKGSVEKGLVDYAGLRRSPKALDDYLATLAATTPADHKTWTRNQRLAFWINAYNAYTIQLVRDKGPVKSIRKLGGLFGSPWEIKFIPMPAFDPDKKNKNLTLDEIEHKLIRPVFNDARVHAAANCASASCPPLRVEAYRGDKLDAQLDEQVRIWLSDPTRNQIKTGASSIKVSEIFKWFKDDFGKDREARVRWIAKYVADEALAKDLRSRAGKIKLKYLSYDWSINAEKSKR